MTDDSWFQDDPYFNDGYDYEPLEPLINPCYQCHQAEGRHMRGDSSGIGGTVCDDCDSLADEQLSFA